MKAVILAGGRGSRIEEESVSRPKPLVEIGDHPIIWHIMNIYAAQGIKDFIVCAGYKGHLVKEYFSRLILYHGDMTVDLASNKVIHHEAKQLDWRVTVADTGLQTDTGGRVKRIKRYLHPDEPFCLTYGDGVADIDLAALLAFHRRHKAKATMTTVLPPARFGAVRSRATGSPLSSRSRWPRTAGSTAASSSSTHRSSTSSKATPPPGSSRPW